MHTDSTNYGYKADVEALASNAMKDGANTQSRFSLRFLFGYRPVA